MSSDSRKIRLILELRRHGVTDTKVMRGRSSGCRASCSSLSAFLDQAYENTALPIGCHQTLSAPIVVGRMTQALELNDRMKVLEVGTGSGYHAAVLSKLCRRVYTIERHRELLEEAREPIQPSWD